MTAYSPSAVLLVRSRPRRVLRGACQATASAALGLAIGIALALAWPVAFGGRALIEMSGSMSPALETGDMAVSRPISPLEARIGDIITFNDPERTGRLITHRVRDIHIGGGRVRFVTGGDANTSIERWGVSAGGRIGRVEYRIPKLGYALVWTTSLPGRLLFTLLPISLLVFFVLRRIWRH